MTINLRIICVGVLFKEKQIAYAFNCKSQYLSNITASIICDKLFFILHCSRVEDSLSLSAVIADNKV